jgi:hypothetical protein
LCIVSDIAAEEVAQAIQAWNITRTRHLTAVILIAPRQPSVQWWRHDMDVRAPISVRHWRHVEERTRVGLLRQQMTFLFLALRSGGA